MIVITTPTGTIGHQVLENLLASGEHLRLVARALADVPGETRQLVEVIEGSHGDPAVVDQAFDGADAVFWLIPPDPRAESVEAAYVGFPPPAPRPRSSVGPAGGLRPRLAGDGRPDRQHRRRLPGADQPVVHG